MRAPHEPAPPITRHPRTSLRGTRWLPATILALGCLTSGGLVEAGELIRYQRADGSLGFTSDLATLPAGAVVLSRGRTTPRGRGERASPEAPSIGELVERVRERCRKRWGRDTDLFRSCLTAQTEAAFRYRDLLLAQPAGTPGRDWLRECRGASRTPDFLAVAECAEQATAAHAAEPLPRLGRGSRRPASNAAAARRGDDRLTRLRDEQSRARVEQSRGRAEWGPRYRKARSEYDRAVESTRDVLARMRLRGCRANSLACGSLVPKLEEARRVEDEKRDYLNNRLPEECRRAGCQPGWLR